MTGANCPCFFSFIGDIIDMTQYVYLEYYGISRFVSWYKLWFLIMIISKGGIPNESKENGRISKTTA